MRILRRAGNPLIHGRLTPRNWLVALVAAAMVFSMIAQTLIAVPILGAAGDPVRLNMFSYGAHTAAYDARLLDICPEYLVDNTAHGFWGEYTGNYNSPSLLQNVAGMQAAGMKVIGYTSCGYEGRGSGGGQPLSMFTLDMVKKQITNMATLDGVDGVFIDECDSYPNAAQKAYLKALSDHAHSLGIIIWANTGVNSFDPWFFNEGGFDLMHSTEQWVGQALSPVQQAYGSRISVAGFQYGYTADDAVRLTLDAWDKGIGYCYINSAEYQTIAPWFEEYADELRSHDGGDADGGNAMPVLGPIGDKTLYVGESLQFVVSASDPDGDALTYTATNLPSGASFNSSTRTLSWTPDAAGVHTGVRFEASDGALSDSEEITITVLEQSSVDNAAPELNEVGDKTIYTGRLLKFLVGAIDPDGDALTYSAANLPLGATFDSTSQTFSWTPAMAGVYSGIRFEVSDGSLTDSEEITVTVLEEPTANRAPELGEIGDKTVAVGEPLEFTISGSDPDGDDLTYTASNLPAFASFETSTPTFSWTPQIAGEYTGIRFEVSDGSLSDSEEIKITVEGNPGGDESGEILKAIESWRDDGFSGTWAYADGSTWYETGSPAAYGTYDSWFRFTGIEIPAGAKILGAHLETVQSRWTAGTQLKIHAEKAGNPSAPASTIDHASRVRTEAGVDWDSGYGDWGWHESPDFAAVVQELVDSYDYSNGDHAIQILVDDDGSVGGSEHVGNTFENNMPPRLYIEYQVPAGNRAPEMEEIGDRTALVGETLEFVVSGTDPDGDALTYTASNLPTGASLDSSTGDFSWTPQAPGVYTGVRFEVSDGTLSDSEEIILTAVQPGLTNVAPVLGAIGDKTVDEGELLEFAVVAGDPNGDALTYSASDLPTGASFDGATRTFSWTPQDPGVYTGIRFEVSDGTLSDSEEITITVLEQLPANQAPVLGAIGYKTVTEGEPLVFVVSASDPDGDALAYTASNLPSGATFNSSTRRFSWTPQGPGVHSGVRFEVSDGSLSDSEEIVITVLERPNRAPVLAPIGSRTVYANQLLSFVVSASDPDGDALTYAASNLPSGATFNSSTRTFTWSYCTAGTYTGIRFEVSDGSLSDSEVITITVLPSPTGGG